MDTETCSDCGGVTAIAEPTPADYRRTDWCGCDPRDEERPEC